MSHDIYIQLTVKQLKELLTMTLDDKVEAISAKLDTLIAQGVKVDLTPVLTAVADVKTVADAILAQDLPTPPAA